MKRTLTFFCGVTLAVGLIGAGKERNATAASGDSTTAVVNIEKFVYNPNPLTVPAGTSVVWINHDVVPHDVVSTDKTFKSKLLEKDEQFSYTFSKPGTYHYICSIHPKMAADLVVK